MRLNEFAKAVGWRLYVADVAGEMWVTDTYWLMRHKGSLAEELVRQATSLTVIASRPDGEQVYLSETLLRIVAGDGWADDDALALRQVADHPTPAAGSFGLLPVWAGDALVMPIKRAD